MQMIEGTAWLATARLMPRRVGLAQALVAQAYGVGIEDIAAPTRRDPQTARARQVAMYLSHVVFHMSLSQVGRAFGRDRSTACYALHHVEDLRDDPETDRKIVRLESLVRAAAGELP
jgi:chromosomal replication initiation ATPase DnaA